MRMWTVAGTVAIGLAVAGLTALPGRAATPNPPPPAATTPAKVAPKPDKPDPKKTLADFRKDPMRVAIVSVARPSCVPDCPRWISAQGSIVAESPAAFAKVLKQMGREKLPVFITSPGGDVSAALDIGRMLRKSGLDVAVGVTLFDGCAPDDAKCSKAKDFRGYRGQSVSIGAYCASACSYLIAGGVRRFAASYSGVGVHQMTTIRSMVQRQFREYYRMENGEKVVVKRELVSEKAVSTKIETASEKDPVTRKVARYLDEMGIKPSLLALAGTATPDEMHWLNVMERRDTGLITDFSSGAVLVYRAPQPMPADITLRGGVAPPQSLAFEAPKAMMAQLVLRGPVVEQRIRLGFDGDSLIAVVLRLTVESGAWTRVSARVEGLPAELATADTEIMVEAREGPSVMIAGLASRRAPEMRTQMPTARACRILRSEALTVTLKVVTPEREIRLGRENIRINMPGFTMPEACDPATAAAAR